MEINIVRTQDGNRTKFTWGSYVCYAETHSIIPGVRNRMTVSASAFVNNGETGSRSFGRNTCSKTFKTWPGAVKAITKWLVARATAQR